ncbi:hypothetical protein [Paenibacillus sp. CGMCC 1.18879]|uniref:hypothetical protein n=1 Tax=Paenibacillus sp. CGMCC 1.18879 TaxID=2834466 RepID=UPI001CA99072|nr:hypothetical protein [Paenibacillus sp. CGMCC 1.18879]MBY9079731.1 hypothetical protein [Paenibacillus sp. CGMCC 1.18879]
MGGSKSIRERSLKKIFLVFLMLIVAGCQKERSLSDQIIQTIDRTSNVNGVSAISLKEITDFKWDKVVIFQVGSSDEEINNALGVKYEGPTDLMSGMVFVLDDKIVHEELIPYQTEHPANLQIFIEKKAKDPNCVAFTLENAVLKGSKEELDDVTYYSIHVKRE